MCKFHHRAAAAKYKHGMMIAPSSITRPMKNPERVGPYTLLSPLGEGVRGHVWLAGIGAGPNRLVLKLAPPGDAVRRARLLHEADIAGGLDHPNIVRMYECGESQGIVWMATGYVAPRFRLGCSSTVLTAYLHCSRTTVMLSRLRLRLAVSINSAHVVSRSVDAASNSAICSSGQAPCRPSLHSK